MDVRALNIYFAHWGNEQNHKRRIIHGYTKTKAHLRDYAIASIWFMQDFYATLEEHTEMASFRAHKQKLMNDPTFLHKCLVKLFRDECFKEDALENCRIVSDFLLQDLNGNMKFLLTDPLPDASDILTRKKLSLCDFCLMSGPANEIPLSEEHLLSVQAIVAII